jgi:hypothetical protein
VVSVASPLHHADVEPRQRGVDLTTRHIPRLHGSSVQHARIFGVCSAPSRAAPSKPYGSFGAGAGRAVRPGRDVDVSHRALDEQLGTIESEEFLPTMLRIVETMPMAETVRLADSLVGLASLRQMIQGETSVGAAIDLAAVTKQGGFGVRTRKAPRAATSPTDPLWCRVGRRHP